MDVQEWLEKVKSNNSETQDASHPFGFVIGWYEGKPYITGPHLTEEEANTDSMKCDPNNVVIIWSKSRQSSAITRFSKHDRLKAGDDLVQATQRARHQID